MLASSVADAYGTGYLAIIDAIESVLARNPDALETHRKGWDFRQDFDRRREEKQPDWKGPSPETLIAKWAVARMMRSHSSRAGTVL